VGQRVDGWDEKSRAMRRGTSDELRVYAEGSRTSSRRDRDLGAPGLLQDEAEDAALGSRRGDALPEELSRRATRLATSEEALRRLEEHAKREADAEVQRRAEAEASASARGRNVEGESQSLWRKAPMTKRRCASRCRVAQHADEQHRLG